MPASPVVRLDCTEFLNIFTRLPRVSMTAAIPEARSVEPRFTFTCNIIVFTVFIFAELLRSFLTNHFFSLKRFTQELSVFYSGKNQMQALMQSAKPIFEKCILFL